MIGEDDVKNLQSYLIFGCILVGGTIFAHSAEKSSCRLVQKLNYLLMFLILLLPLAFRGETVGIDTVTYYKWFDSASKFYDGEKFFLYWEPGFALLIKLLMLLSNNSTFVMFVFDFFILYFIVSRLWEYKGRMPFSEGIFLFITLFYLFCFNLTRQMLALALVFWATRYLEKKKYLWFLLFVVLASTIHATSVVCSLILLVYMFLPKAEVYKKEIEFVLLVGLSVIVMLLALLFNDNSISVIDRIQHYINKYLIIGNVNLGFMYVVRFVAISLTFCLIYRISNRNNDQVKINNFLYFIGTVLALVGSFFEFVERLGLFFLVYVCVLFPIIFNSDYFNKRSKILLKWGVYSLCMLLYLIALVGNSQGQMPYVLL